MSENASDVLGLLVSGIEHLSSNAGNGCQTIRFNTGLSDSAVV